MTITRIVNKTYEELCNPPKEGGCLVERRKNVRYCVYYGHRNCSQNCYYALEVNRRRNEIENTK